MRRFWKGLLFFVALLPTAALAQGAIQQSGPIVPFHLPIWFQNGVQGDGGSASGVSSSGSIFAGASESLLILHGTGTPPFANAGSGPFGTNACNYDAPVNNATGYHYLCFSPNAQGGGLIAYGAGNGAAQLPLSMILNGITYQFPFVLSGIVGPPTTVISDLACWGNTVGTLLSDCGPNPNALRIIASGTTDTATAADVTIAWNSAATSAKTESLYACGSAQKGDQITIKDEKGNSSTYPVGIDANGGNTIDGLSVYYLAFNLQSAWLQCDGSGNWIVK